MSCWKRKKHNVRITNTPRFSREMFVIDITSLKFRIHDSIRRSWVLLLALLLLRLLQWLFSRFLLFFGRKRRVMMMIVLGFLIARLILFEYFFVTEESNEFLIKQMTRDFDCDGTIILCNKILPRVGEGGWWGMKGTNNKLDFFRPCCALQPDVKVLTRLTVLAHVTLILKK